MSDQPQWHLANIWENVAEAIPDAPAVSMGDRQLTWRQYEKRASQLAQVFVDNGLSANSKVSIYSYNSIEYLEAQFSAFKARMCPININYRYLETELAHVIANSDSEALVYQASFAPRVAAIRDQLPQVKLFLEIDDGSGEHLEGAKSYEEELSKASPMPVIERSNDDIYMLYTGGTTGLPKGVMYDHKTFSSALISKALGLRGIEPPKSQDDIGPIAKAMADKGTSPRSLPACPLMHGTGMWVGVVIPHAMGGNVTLFDNRKFDAEALLDLIVEEKVQEIVIVGDVFAKPMVKALNEAKASGKPYDMSSLKMVNSSGVMWSAETKKQLLEHMDVMIFDSMGSTEGSMGTAIATRDSINTDQTGKFQLSPTTKVFNENEQEVKPGSGEVGLICNGGMVPIGYYKDEKKSAETFKVINGVRYSIPGDYASVEEDGSITLLGRGSTCINSGGEKIFPEEVEEAMKLHDSVYDCLVVGVPDDRFGQSVTAVYSLAEGQN